MKSEVYSLMNEKNIDAIVISGASEHNPPMAYFSFGGFFTKADIVVLKNGKTILFYRPMERDTAAKTGLERICYTELDYSVNKGSDAAGRASELQSMFEKIGLMKGRVAFCGRLEFGEHYPAVQALKAMMPDIEVLGDEGIRILNMARFRKDQNEIDSIRHMGKVCTEVVRRVESFLCSNYLKDNKLVTAEGEAVTIGKVKQLINLWLGELGAENPEGTIFSLGRDAGVPHNQGVDDQVLEGGKSIVFDFFPCEMGGGYFYDFTRTWCLAYAPEKVQHAYQQVKQVHDQLIDEMQVNQLFKSVQLRTCELLSQMGHKTVKDSPNTLSGFVHSVGHGLGLNIHERPFSGFSASDADILAVGTVFTIEPGVYYPEEADGFGVRIEDTLYMGEDGKAHIFVEYPYNLTLPVKDWSENGR